jgi:hypothetical protein
MGIDESTRSPKGLQNEQGCVPEYSQAILLVIETTQKVPFTS